MKSIFKIAVLTVLLSCSMFSCNDYLDVTPKGSKVLKTAEDYAELFNYPSRMQMTRYGSTQQPLSDNVWYNVLAALRDTVTPSLQNIVFLYRDYDPDKLSRIPWYNETSTNPGAEMYSGLYSNIGAYNMVIDNIDNATEATPSRKAQLKAEAKIMVAYSHFMLVNIFAKQYNASTASTDKAVPIRSKYDLEATVSQNSVAEVYSFIERTIDESLPYLSDAPENIYHPSAAAGYALKARVHLFKYEYAKAKAAALESYKHNSQLLNWVTYYQSGTSANTRPVINAEVGENLILGVASSASGYDYFNSAMSPDLYQKFDTVNDARFKGFFDPNSIVINIDKGFSPVYNVPSSRFFYNSAGMRVSEVLLMLAECYAREGDFSKAMDYVTELRNARIINNASQPAPVVTSVAQALDIILTERRKEFIFGPLRVFDLRRMNGEGLYPITVTKVFPANPNDPNYKQKTYTLNPNSYLYIFPFPQNVLLRDTYLTNNTPERVR